MIALPAASLRAAAGALSALAFPARGLARVELPTRAHDTARLASPDSLRRLVLLTSRQPAFLAEKNQSRL